MNFIKKVKNKIILFFNSLIYGMKNTEEIVFHNNKNNIDGNTSIIKEVEDHSVAKALLRGEITQEVEELRYRTYLVDKESKNYKYYSPTLAIKNNDRLYKDIIYDTSDGLEIITSQYNDDISNEGWNKYLDNVVKLSKKKKISYNDVKAGVRGNVNKRIHIQRDFIPRFKLENFITRIDIKKYDENHMILDLFFSKYPMDDTYISKGFINELEKIKNGNRSEIVDFNTLEFTTNHAYMLPDLVKFAFRNIRFIEIKEFDGHYIMRFKANFVKQETDLTKKYYSKTMDDKYKNKVKKEVILNVGEYLTKEKYICSDCGKEILVDYKLLDELRYYDGHDITKENIKSENKQVTEFMDMQISEQTLGRRLCSDCLRKYIV